MEFIDVITFHFSDLERSMSRSLRFGRLISRKVDELGHMLLLDTTRKPYMGRPCVTVINSRSLRF